MKITAKLAYSQLKINRSRTLWTWLAVALSTALTTAVCSFVASGNAMIVNFLGADYGAYGNSYVSLLLIPAIFFGILIFAMSVTVISNVFRISAKERITQFGILKCTGATRKQIMNTVMYESVFLCLIGIPAGILLGLLLALGGIGIANHYMEELNALAHMMINEINLTIGFVLSGQAILAAVLISFFTVLFSAWRAAYKASKTSAIDCIRGEGEIKIEQKQIRTSPLIGKLFGFEGTLAAKNLKRNRQNFRATLISLSVGVILCVGLGGLSSQARALENYIYPKRSQTVISEYTSAYEREVNPKTGRREETYLRPIDSDFGNEIAQKLEEYDGGTDIYGMGNDWDTYDTILRGDMLSDAMVEAMKKQGQESDEFAVEIITLDAEHYESLCEKAGVSRGSAILLNHYRFNDFGKEVNLQPFSEKLKEITLTKADGKCEKIEVAGMLTQEEMTPELFYPNTNPVRLIVPQAVVRGYTWYCSPEDIEGFMAYSNQVLKEEFPTKGDSYMEEGFNTRVYKTREYVKVMNIAIALVSVFMYSFVALLLLIGLTNVISTLSTNVLMRAREFAVLKSVGMTSESLTRMLNFESILCSVRALLYGLPIGILLTLLVNLPIRLMFPIPYELPWFAITLCVLVVFLITFSTTRYAAHKLKNQNIIETIRSESGK